MAYIRRCIHRIIKMAKKKCQHQYAPLVVAVLLFCAIFKCDILTTPLIIICGLSIACWVEYQLVDKKNDSKNDVKSLSDKEEGDT